MRISTSMMHSNALNAMMKRQTELSKTQNEVASGQRVSKPSDDPAAAVRILQLEQAKAASTQYGENISAVNTSLQLEEQALADIQSTLQRVYELAIQANSAALGDSDRQAISTELDGLSEELMDIANRKDNAGEYLFAGYASSTQPFARDGSGNAVYSGAAFVRSVQVSASQYVEQGDAGDSVFVNVPEGNGLFVLGASDTNTGSGVIGGTVLNRADWVADDYTLTFTSATDWEVRDSSSNLVTSGTYTEGAAIEFNGVQVTLTGTPASGDSFSIEASENEDIFSTIDKLRAALDGATDTDAQKAQFQNQLSAVLTQLDKAEAHVLSVRTSVGVRMSMLETVDSTREDTLANITSSLSGLRDSDYAEAVSRLSQQYVGLEAAQQSYAKIAQLSLFNYLK